METNGWVHTRGYRTVAEPEWVDPLLHVPNGLESDTVLDVCAWRLATGDYLAAYLTQVNVVLINLTANLQVGSAPCPAAEGFQQLIELNGYLYLAHDGQGVYRLYWSTMQGNSPVTAWDLYLSTTTAPALLSSRVTGIYGFNADGAIGDDGEHAGFLAVCSRLDDRDGLYQAEIVDLEAGISHRAAPWWRHLSPRRVYGLGARLYFVCGNFVAVKYDGAELTAGKSGWLADATVCGALTDTFATGELSEGWLIDERHGFVTCQPNDLSLGVVAEEDGTRGYVFCRRNALIAGEITVILALEIEWPEDDNDHQSFVSFQIHLPHGDEQLLALQRRRTVVDGGVSDRLLVLRNGVEIQSFDFPLNRFWLRVERKLDPLTGYSSLRLSGGEFGYFSVPDVTVVDDLPSGPLAFNVHTESDSHVPMNCRVLAMDSLQSLYTAYQGLPSSEITALALASPSAWEDSTTLFVGFASGLWICQTDESQPRRSEGNGRLRGGYGATDSAFNVLPDGVNRIESLTSSAFAEMRRDFYGVEEIVGFGQVAVGTAAGLSVIDLASDAVSFFANPQTAQPLVDPRVESLNQANGFVYGTPKGGGFINIDDEAPADTEVYCQEYGRRILLGWRQPTNADYRGSRLYRAGSLGMVYGDDEWQVLRVDGFDGVGKEVLFTANRAFFDETILTDGRYRYKVTHLDWLGHESEGTTVTAYIDEPIVSSVIVNDGNATVYRRGIELRILGNSGMDSGCAPDAIGYVRIVEQGRDPLSVPLMRYETGKFFPFVLSAGLPDQFVTRTIEVIPYSRGMISGGPFVVDLSLFDRDAASAAEALAPVRTFILAYEYIGDTATISAQGGNDEYPPANVLDPRLGLKWRSSRVSGVSLTMDFGQFLPLRYFAVLGHNFANFIQASGRLQIVLSCTEKHGGVESVEEYDLTNLAGQKSLLVDLESKSIRSLKLELSFIPDGFGYTPALFEIGRLLAIGEGDGVIQPIFNFSSDYSWGIKEYARLFASPGGRYAANPVYVRTAEIRLEDYRNDQRELLSRAFARVGRHRPVFAILDPEQVLTATRLKSIDWSSTALTDCLAVYGYFLDDQQNWRMRSDDYGSTVLRIEEAGE